MGRTIDIVQSMSMPRVARPGVDVSTWADQKWVRGTRHLTSVSEVAAAWEAGGHVWVDLTLSEDQFYIDATLRMNVSPPLEEMALRLGDALHCYRSALDSLAWSLCHLDGGVPAQPNRVYFPCIGTESKWKAAAGTLASMPPEFLERIRQVQPFVTGPGSPLQLLVDMSNYDKHRGMVTGRANPATLAIGIDTGGATGSRNGIHNGMRLELLNEARTLADGIPFARVETSVPVTLSHAREPVGLEYVVTVGDQDHPLRDVQLALIHLQQVMIFVREGIIPPPEASPSTPSGP